MSLAPLLLITMSTSAMFAGEQAWQCDEIWSFVGAKRKNVTPEQEEDGWGDVWTWTAIDADTKLCVTYYVGDRGRHSAYNFMRDAANRIVGRPQITTDAHRPYLEAVEFAFGTDVDYAQLHKIYGAPTPDESRYSPATCIGCDMKTVMGDPDPKHVSTSFVERQNLTMYAHVESPVFTRLDKRNQHETGDSWAHGCPAHHALQLRPRSQNATNNARNGCRHYRPRLVS